MKPIHIYTTTAPLLTSLYIALHLDQKVDRCDRQGQIGVTRNRKAPAVLGLKVYKQFRYKYMPVPIRFYSNR
ncbi:hypothetical protein N483_27390 [Pseudoalteromonas luteoviolacea NCIMB 1944]|nr:hypothetical protein N483_27390 [Pseudoalteromonas luteoviolacea NCIMB 1944]